ncbi:MAG: hypothetical protein K9G26_04685 [Emcibacter sp.]|nr:hypothetical protein [Emcibacter sp.]
MPITLYGVAIKWDLGCLKGKTENCMRLALALETGEGDLKAEIRAALGYYLSACDKGEGDGCTRAAMIIREGMANFSNEDLAQKTATRGCDVLGNQDSCVVKAIGIALGESPLENPTSYTLINNACLQNSDYGCEIKATELFYRHKDDASIKTAIGLFEKACRNKNAWGCTLLAEAYNTGIGVREDKTKAMDAARKGCLESQGNTIPACSLYGYFLTQGGSSGNMNVGVKLLSKACVAHDGFACNAAGMIGWKRPLGSGIAAWEVPLYFRDGCDLGNGEACFNLAMIYENGYGKLKQYQSTKLPLLDKACRLGSTDACKNIESLGPLEALLRKRPSKVDPSLTALQQLAVANELIEQQKYATALDAVVRLAFEGVAEAGYLLGGWMYYGDPRMFRQPRKEDGVILIENAARLSHVEAAKWIGMAYWYGDGVVENRQKGLRYMSIAAARGDEMAGSIYRSMLAEPIREAYRRSQREMEEEAERRKTDWGYQISLAASAWSRANSGGSYGGSSNQGAARASWQRSQQAMDKLNWNNAVGYATGKTTACPISNPYC